MVINRQVATDIDVHVHVGKRLRVRRSLVGVTQERLGADLGISFQQIQKYERGVNRISAGRLFEIGRLLDLPIGCFYEGIGVSCNDKIPETSEIKEIGNIFDDKESLSLLKALSAD